MELGRHDDLFDTLAAQIRTHGHLPGSSYLPRDTVQPPEELG